MPRGIPETGKRKKGAGPKPLPPEKKKVRAVTYIEPDLADWLRSNPGLHYQIIRQKFEENRNMLTYTANDKTITLSTEDVMQRLGSDATTADAQAFIKVWNTRFHDSGAPDFTDDEEDLDATWEECLAMI